MVNYKQKLRRTSAHLKHLLFGIDRATAGLCVQCFTSSNERKLQLNVRESHKTTLTKYVNYIIDRNCDSDHDSWKG